MNTSPCTWSLDTFTSHKSGAYHDTLLLSADEGLEQASGHLDTEALLAVSDVISGNMLKQAEDARRASRRMSACVVSCPAHVHNDFAHAHQCTVLKGGLMFGAPWLSLMMRSLGCSSGDMRRSMKGVCQQQCVSPEVAAHAVTLLAAMPEQNSTTGSDDCDTADPSRDPRTSKSWGAASAPLEQSVAQESLACRALRSALAMYDISLAVSS